MKRITLLLCLFVYASFFSAAQENDVKKSKVYYCIEQLEEEEFWNNITYPRPDMPKEQLAEFIKSRIHYPELARKYFKSSTFTMPVKIGVDGNATVVTDYMTDNEFEQAAISFLSDKDLKWIAGKRNNRSKEMEINVPFMFTITHQENKMYFNAAVFSGLGFFVMDSTDNYPSFVDNEEASMNFINDKYLMAPPSWELNREYGTVTLGFEIDTNGSIQDLKVLTSVNNILDEQALDFIQKTDGKWSPGRRNGEKVASYKYFNCYFNDVYFESYLAVNETRLRNLRSKFSNATEKGYKPYNSIAHYEYALAMSLLAEKDYKNALTYFNRAGKYFIKDANLFYNRSIALHYEDNAIKSCDDLQRVLEIAETEGFPPGITKQKVEELIVKFCQ